MNVGEIATVHAVRWLTCLVIVNCMAVHLVTVVVVEVLRSDASLIVN